MSKGNIAGLEFENLYLIKDNSNKVLALRFRTSSKSKANAIGNNFGKDSVSVNDRRYPTKGGIYQHLITQIPAHYNTFYEGYVINRDVDKSFLFTTQKDVIMDFYNYVMERFNLPIPKEFAEYLYLESARENITDEVWKPYELGYGNTLSAEDYFVPHGTKRIRLSELMVLNVAGVTEEMLRKNISKGLTEQKIFLDKENHLLMDKLEIGGMDDYTVKYGNSLCKHLEKELIRPKSRNLRKSVDGLALLSRKLYPPQAATVDGIVSSIQAGDNYIFVSEEMGCGKTIQAASAVEAYYNQKWLKNHPGKTLKDCFASGEVNYRVVIMCPSHLCVKWKHEVESQIPGAKGILVTDISQLAALRKLNPKQRNGKEFFIFSKEFAKGDTYKRPVPTKLITKVPVGLLCYDCLEASASEGNEFHQMVLNKKEPWTRKELDNTRLIRIPMVIRNGKPTCIHCKGHNGHKYELHYPRQLMDGTMTDRYTGLRCPSCDELLITTSQAVYNGEVEDFNKYVLDAASFAAKTKDNEVCGCCGTSLWEDNVQSYNIPLNGVPTPVEDEVRDILDENGNPVLDKNGVVMTEKVPKKGWIKIKFAGDYAKLKLGDAKKRLNKSGYALRGHELETVTKRGVGTEYAYTKREYGPRRYSPARYAKKYLRGYFDILIADEAHLYEGCRTEQAIAMHCLLKTVKFSMLLTGTLTNGAANSLFNIHFMVNPGRMKELGYSYTTDSEKSFSERYGVIETKYQINENSWGEYNAQGRGRQIGSPTVKPGISPMVYPDLLLNNTVQLNIGDMSNKLPPLNEFVEVIDMNEDQRAGYEQAISNIKDAMSNPPIGAGLMGKMLQLGLSYVDKPYGREDIWSLKVKNELICSPENYEQYRDPKNLLPKEERLVEIVNKEISEGRNCFIYTEYSGKEETNIDERILQIVETHCNLKGQVRVLKSKDVKASEREEFIKKNSDKIKIWITNYRNVETGIDFVGEYEGRKFNYPTLIYMQCGMSLSSIWQSSRRHYRLNQTEECRTYYLTYKGTFQLDMLEMMSKKMSAASAIQGNFSESALENMAGSEDPAVVLAKKIMSGQTGGEVDIDIAEQLAKTRQLAIEACDDSLYEGPEPVTYYDVMGEGVIYTGAEDDDIMSQMMAVIGDVEEVAVVTSETVETPTQSETDLLDEFFASMAELSVTAVTETDRKAIKKKSARPLEGQLLFDFGLATA